MHITVKKFVEETPAKLCRVSKKVLGQLKLFEGKQYMLVAGQRRAIVLMSAGGDDGDDMHFSPDVFEELLLVSNCRLNIWYAGDAIHLGPVVGVVVHPSTLSRLAKNRPPLSVRKLMQANEFNACFLYYFSVQGIRWNENKLKGLVYHPALRTWKNSWLPLPNVVYDRAIGIDAENKGLARHMVRCLRSHPGIHLINYVSAFGKWQTYKALSTYPELSRVLPKTVLYRSFSDVKEMLQHHTLVFIKTFWGSRGEEVMAIEKKQHHYDITFYDMKLKTVRVTGMDQLKTHVREFTKDKRCIVQRGIRLFRIQDQPFDMRVHLNKDSTGRWSQSYNCARISTKKLPITNHAQGAEVMHYRDLQRKDPMHLPTEEQVLGTAIKIASYLEKAFGNLGEIGLDLAIDEKGQIWFIEANGKPDKTLLNTYDETVGISPQYASILEYVQFLAINLEPFHMPVTLLCDTHTTVP